MEIVEGAVDGVVSGEAGDPAAELERLLDVVVALVDALRLLLGRHAQRKERYHGEQDCEFMMCSVHGVSFTGRRFRFGWSRGSAYGRSCRHGISAPGCGRREYQAPVYRW